MTTPFKANTVTSNKLLIVQCQDNQVSGVHLQIQIHQGQNQFSHG